MRNSYFLTAERQTLEERKVCKESLTKHKNFIFRRDF